MSDEKGPDAKIIGVPEVPETDPRWAHVRQLEDVPRHLLGEIGKPPMP